MDDPDAGPSASGVDGQEAVSADATAAEDPGPKVTALFRRDPPPLSREVLYRNVFGTVVKRLACDDAEAASHWSQQWRSLP